MENHVLDVISQKTVKSLEGFFNPGSVVVIGASSNPDKIGHQILQNILEGGFEGKVFAVHPKEKNILGSAAFQNVSEVPGEVDLAVIAVPAAKVPGVFEDCVQKNIQCIAIISSGFAETGNMAAQNRIKELADQHRISVLGPNMFGVVYAPAKLNASFGPKVSLKGKIAFISQSGAIGISLMGWAEMENIGIGSLVSLGNKVDVNEKELIEHFNRDPNIEVILIYMEGLKNAREFMNVHIKKPVVVLKVGRSERGAKAAASHTGSLAGSDKIYDAALRQLGIIRAQTFTEAFGWSRALSLPFPKGQETLIITNGGGIGVRTSDECEKYGVSLLEDSQWLEQIFRPFMPDFGSTGNPVDITGEAGLQGYRNAIRAALEQDRIHSLIVLYCETTVSQPLEVGKVIEEEFTSSGRKKPLINVFLGGERTRQAINFLNSKHIPAFTSVNEAVSALRALQDWREISMRKSSNAVIEPPSQEAFSIIDQAKKQGRLSLLEHEAMRVLQLCGIQTAPSAFAANMDELLEKSENLFPLAMKISSPDILHKTDVDGVILNIRNTEELLLKYHNMMKRIAKQRPDAQLLGVNLVQMIKGIECIVGLSEDDQFGPTVMFGLGGVFVETLKDVSFRVIPFDPAQAGQLVDEIKGAQILKGFRGYSANIPSLVQTLCSIQRLAGLVKEVDINPLICNQSGSIAVDARIIL